jgi:MraZ protein
MRFMGEYNHTVDTKGRLIIPTDFREGLGTKFVVTKGFDGCLFAYPQEAWEQFEEKLEALPLVRKEARTLVRFFVSGARMCELDKQGRILVPSVLREFAGLEKDVVLAGATNRVEIWSKSRWAEVSAVDDMEDIAQQMADLGLDI